VAGKPLPGAQPLAIRTQLRYASPEEDTTMTCVQSKATPNWPQVKPDDPWTGRCVQEKIAADGKRHQCHKTEKHRDIVHACKCSMKWK